MAVGLEVVIHLYLYKPLTETATGSVKIETFLDSSLI